MRTKLSRNDVEGQIREFFKLIKNKSPAEIRKIKRLAMSKNIKLGEKRKTFCGKCLAPYNKPKIRIKNKKKIVTCVKCGNISRWKL